MDKYIGILQEKYGMPCLRVDLYYHYVVKKGKHVICPTPGQFISLDIICHGTPSAKLFDDYLKQIEKTECSTPCLITCIRHVSLSVQI